MSKLGQGYLPSAVGEEVGNLAERVAVAAWTYYEETGRYPKAVYLHPRTLEALKRQLSRWPVPFFDAESVDLIRFQGMEVRCIEQDEVVIA